MPALTTANLVAYALQVAALVAIGAGLPVALRLTSPRARLAYWRLLLLVCLALPLVQPLGPAPSRTTQPAGFSAGGPSATVVSAPAAPGVPGGQVPPVPAGPGPWSLDRLVAIALVSGIVARLIWLGVGLISLRRLRRLAALLEPRPPAVEDATLLTGADAEFRITPAIARPVTFGAARPVVLVPDEFRALGAEQQRAVACHELVHVRRHDWLRTLGDEVVRSVFWFHPALWWLLDQVHLALEQVVDQEVVEITEARQPYLDALLRLAAPAPLVSLRPASMFIRRSHLRERVALLLKEVSMSRSRLIASFVTMAAVLFVSGRLVVSAFPLEGTVPVPVVAVQPVQEAEAVPAAVPVAQSQSTQAAQSQGSKRPGEATAKPQPPRAPSNMPAKIHDVDPIFPAGAPADANGVVVLTHTVNAAGLVTDVKVLKGDSPFAEAAVDAVRQWRYEPPKVAPWVTAVALNVVPQGGELSRAKSVRVGGNLRPPTKIKDVKPVYPAEAQAERVQGVVILELFIDSSGIVTDARVLRSIPLLDAAALEAATQWRFVPPLLLNGAPVPVVMTVTVNFTLDGGVARTGVVGDVVGGVAGGVAGGVVGGVAGGASGRAAAAEREASSVRDAARGLGATGDFVRVGGNVKAPRKIRDVKPVYPEVAATARVQGVVIVEALIGTDGTVQDVKILRSIPLLDQAALDAVRQWEFEPTIIDGQPVRVIMTLTVNFTLQ